MGPEKTKPTDHRLNVVKTVNQNKFSFKVDLLRYFVIAMKSNVSSYTYQCKYERIHIMFIKTSRAKDPYRIILTNNKV